METSEGIKLVKARPGRWLPQDPALVDSWIRRLKQTVADNPLTLVPPIAELSDMVAGDDALRAQVDAMFAQALENEKLTPLGQVAVKNFTEFLELLNAIMRTAPEAYQRVSPPEPAGLIGFPINALLDWPMATDAGYAVFSNQLFNQQFNKILAYWSQFLVSEESRYVLTQKPYKLTQDTDVVPWLGDGAKAEMVKVARSALGPEPNPIPATATFAEIFKCDPKDEYYGFPSWDGFFTRTFQQGVRPVPVEDADVIVNACESAPLQLKTDVALTAPFWVKGQQYSLANILNFDENYLQEFAGGMVYQAFLSALSYHRWQSPVNGVVKKAYVVKGSYYLENLWEGFRNPEGADPSGPNQSQPFLTAVATRALIFIEANNDKIGLMCVVAVGMAEVSSCEITVKEGDPVKKGEQLGMFHFGGSTHCLVFRPGVNLKFNFYGQTPNIDATNIRVNAALATVL